MIQTNINIKSHLKEKAAVFEKSLKTFLSNNTRISTTLSDAMSYSLLAGGKRIRPVLAMSSYEMLQHSVLKKS